MELPIENVHCVIQVIMLHTEISWFSHSVTVNCQTEAKENACMNMKRGPKDQLRTSTRMLFLRWMAATELPTLTWRGRFLQGFFPLFLIFFGVTYTVVTTFHYLNKDLLISFLAVYSYLKATEQLEPASHWRHVCNWLQRGLLLM